MSVRVSDPRDLMNSVLGTGPKVGTYTQEIGIAVETKWHVDLPLGLQV